jgi:hypothetical protein
MKSFLFCTCYVKQGIGEMHPKRYNKWLKYYRLILGELGAGHIFMIDDCSDENDLLGIAETDAFYSAERPPDVCEGIVNVFSFDSHLGKPSPELYPGWWRSFTYSAVLAGRYQFDKIIHVESDFFILSDRLRKYIANIRTGWVSLYSRAFNFPETAIQVICKDSFPTLRVIADQARRNQFDFKKMAELVLPFTTVNKDFIGDRFGEFHVFRHWARMNDAVEFDYIGQLSKNLVVPSSVEFRSLLSAFSSRSTGADTDVAMLMELLTAKRLIDTV